MTSSRPDQSTGTQAGYRKLRTQLLLEGLFKANPWYYAQKMGHQVNPAPYLRVSDPEI